MHYTTQFYGYFKRNFFSFIVYFCASVHEVSVSNPYQKYTGSFYTHPHVHNINLYVIDLFFTDIDDSNSTRTLQDRH